MTTTVNPTHRAAGTPTPGATTPAGAAHATASATPTPHVSRPSLRSRARAYWVGDLPSPWTEPPATLAELVRYARRGAWCSDDAPFLRFLGQAYCYLIAIPLSFKHYMQAWAAQRPGRFLALTALTLVLKLTVGLAFLATLRFFVL